MRTKSLRFCSARLLIAVAITTSLAVLAARPAATAHAESPFWGQQDIDYWAEGKTIPGYRSRDKRRREKTQEQQNSHFWREATDPVSPLFWNDEQVSQFASANPTEENINRYLEWKERKHALVATFIERVVERESEKLRQLREHEHGITWRDMTIVYYYSSSCSACLSHRDTVADLASRGARITFRRMDDSEQLYDDEPATEAEKSFVKLTPTMVVSYRGTTKFATGAMTLDALALLMGKPK